MSPVQIWVLAPFLFSIGSKNRRLWYQNATNNVFFIENNSTQKSDYKELFILFIDTKMVKLSELKSFKNKIKFLDLIVLIGDIPSLH